MFIRFIFYKYFRSALDQIINYVMLILKRLIVVFPSICHQFRNVQKNVKFEMTTIVKCNQLINLFRYFIFALMNKIGNSSFSSKNWFFSSHQYQFYNIEWSKVSLIHKNHWRCTLTLWCNKIIKLKHEKMRKISDFNEVFSFNAERNFEIKNIWYAQLYHSS